MNKLMNPREAIIELNRLKTGVRTPTDFDRRDRAIETAKAAIHKQIAQKPSLLSEHLVCTNCLKPIINVLTNAKYKPKYCHYCGQALDWSEE